MLTARLAKERSQVYNCIVFNPTEIIFAPTTRCNLSCSHCRVRTSSTELPLADALDFLDRCANEGIERIGFSGGEPFLALDFLVAACKLAVQRDMLFDRLMTNGCWWKDQAELDASLKRIADAGFDGTIGLSHDAYHGQSPQLMAEFIQAAHRAFGARDCVEILSVRSPDDGAFLTGMKTLADLLGGSLILDDGEPVAIADRSSRTGEELAGELLSIPVLRSPRSAGADEAAWTSERWFKDDYCEGPGNVLYVHSDGTVAACCGFANENPQLILGTIQDAFSDIMENAAKNSHVQMCYESGLATHRAALEQQGTRFPGKTSDPCFFCDWLCKHGPSK